MKPKAILALALILLASTPTFASIPSGRRKTANKKTEAPAVQPATEGTNPVPPAAPAGSKKDKSEGSRFLEPDFRGEEISLELNGTDLYEFLEFFNNNFGLNYVIDESVPKTSISVRVSKQPWNVVVRSVLRAKRLTIRRDDTETEIFRVMTIKASSDEEEQIRKERETTELNGTRIQKIYKLKNRNVRTGAFLRAGQSGADTSVTSAGGAGGGSTGGPNAGALQGSGLKAIITSLLTQIGTVQEDPESNSLIVNDTPVAQDRVQNILDQLDKPEPVIEIEARVVVARRDFTRNLGVIINAGANSTGLGVQGGTTPNPIAGVRPVGAPQIPGGQPNGTLGLGSAANSAFGFVLSRGTYSLSAAINALETKGIGRTILAPRTKVFNNMQAQLGNGVDIPYVQASPVAGGAGGVGVAQTTQFANASLGFTVTPQVAGDQIILKIDIKNDSPNGSTVNGLPLITRQTASTTVPCPNGGTILISGLLSNQESLNLNRVPGLANIPGLGKLFERKDRLVSEVELLFFVTARVVTEGEVETIVERPQGIDVPNSPEQQSRPLPPIDAPKATAPRQKAEKVKTPPPTVPNPNAKNTGKPVESTETEKKKGDQE